MKTHDVTNQTPPMTGKNAYLGDPLLMQIAARFPKELHTDLEQTGRFVMSAEAQDLARLANTELPKLRTHDRQGNRIDLVEYHPAYHALMRRSIAAGLHCSIWEGNPLETGRRHQARASRFFLTAQLEAGHLCPLTMTSASLAALMASSEIYREWSPIILSRKYDFSQKPAFAKQGITLGMGMTEKQGGTDVRANTTRATRNEDGTYSITGHKWFMSAPMSDAFMALAQTEDGLSCFLLPRLTPEGSGNGFFFQRLKDKLGNKSNASSEVEFDGAVGHLIGNPGEGIKTIMDMVTLTRLDCAVASAGLMRSGLAEAVHHSRHRQVFGKALVEQPLMQRVLADMAIDVAGATALSMRLARAFDMAASDRAEAAFARCMTPVVKYWVCKIAPALLYEAMECLGGNGYIEEGNLARAYREAPVNAIWEGSGNVMALDVARVLSRAPGLFDEVLEWIGGQLGARGQGTLDVLRAALQLTETDPGVARLLTEQLAYAAAAAELRQLGADDVADAFIETRLGGQWRSTYGMLDARHNAERILDQLYPAS
ncbi:MULTISPECIES: acyl-CoA dehydrogenase family protein [Brucella/Ochrobactrum group]|uniref:Acyl-CoA dehydrogenase family protein n=1 Tax=Brucella pseudintermedia TaxID=370111 RepID=A0ABY5UG61_9HYPH|nr:MULTISPECIES: acyl-CoA dehydrogenase family protein [Brucella/Ochrobactrum group]KAB2679795.1 DNA alkylation response protein [Brucella pseudintermedia]MCO7727413.1 acyl-CoA dehydrogenase family protein [Brucella intermedia]TWH00996.1 putative acyl-CoA dehydrogenase [Ochrobactrum sp. J50]UWL62336.1 acyl-CoA dehydrogenase family protein [Brucella pseudintermedia]WPM82735.1 acyl-CoA dehydrogenase family protein [Brucella pseudintermedia]